MNLKPFFKSAWGLIKRNSTKILAGGAIAAEVLGFYFMHKEAPVVRKRLDALPEGTKWYEKVKVAGPVYLPAIGMLVLSTGCIVGGCALGERKAAIMASLYSASEASIRRLEEKLVDEIGPEKAKELHDAAVEDLAKANPPSPSNVKLTGKGDQLFFERRTGQWFRSDYNAVINAATTFNGYLLEKCGAGLDFNEWLECLGAERSEFGDYWGFNVDHKLNLSLTDSHKTETGEQYFIIDYIDNHGYGPVMYNGKRGLEFYRSEDCYPPEF